MTGDEWLNACPWEEDRVGGRIERPSHREGGVNQ